MDESRAPQSWNSASAGQEPLPSDAKILDELARRYGSALRLFLKRRLPASEDAEDLVQETLFRLARRANLADIDQLEGYLFQTARAVLRDRFRELYRSSNEDSSWPDLNEELSPERVLLGKEAVTRVMKALDELPMRSRNAFVLHRFEHLQYKEIAIRLKVSVSTVEKDIMQALAHITERIDIDRS